MAREDLGSNVGPASSRIQSLQGRRKQAGSTNRIRQNLQSPSKIGAKGSTVLKQEIKYQGTAR